MSDALNSSLRCAPAPVRAATVRERCANPPLNSKLRGTLSLPHGRGSGRRRLSYRPDQRQSGAGASACQQRPSLPPACQRPNPQAGVTLIEVLVAITLLSLLTTGMLFAMRVGLLAYSKTTAKLMDNRRVAGAQRILESELQGTMPVVAPCTGVQGGTASGSPMEGPLFAFFQANPQSMRLISGFSLQGGWRGMPKILEFVVIPGEDGRGVRLLVNEIPYGGPLAAGRLCSGLANDPVAGGPMPRFPPVQAGPSSFVLADRLAFCRFSYQWLPSRQQEPQQGPQMPVWSPTALSFSWPMAIRVEMAPLDFSPATLQPLTIIAPLHLHASPAIGYVD